jgi:hypothetical protein
MSHRPSHEKSLREYVKGLSLWAKIGWTVLLGYIFGRIVYWVGKLL